MVFHGHNPALHLTINIPLPHCPYINKIHLKTIAELRKQDGLCCPFPCQHLWMLLMVEKTVINEQFTQLVGGAVEHRTIGEGLVHLQMVLPAMSLVDDVKDVKHVEDNAPRLLVLENDFELPIETCGLLNLKLLGVTVSLDVFLMEIPTCVCVGVLR